MSVVRAVGDDVLIQVKAVPGASRDAIAGVLGDRLKIRVRAAPEGGKANKAICTVLARALDVKPGQVSIEQGHATAEKVLRVRSVDVTAVERRFATEGKEQRR